MSDSKFSPKDYNFVAKRIREVYPLNVTKDTLPLIYAQRRKLEQLALSFAKKYAEDSKFFEPLKFLDTCSPDPEKYPLSELWEE